MQPHSASTSSGFTLVELLMSLVLSGLVAMGVFSAFLLNQNGWMLTTLTIQSSSQASAALEKLVYGTGGPSLRSQRRAEVVLRDELDDDGSWQVAYDGGARWFGYDAGAGVLMNDEGDVLCEQVESCEASLQDQGLRLDLTVTDEGRQFLSTSTMRSFVRFRN